MENEGGRWFSFVHATPEEEKKQRKKKRIDRGG